MAIQTPLRAAVSRPAATDRCTLPMPICQLRPPSAFPANRLHEPTEPDQDFPNRTTSDHSSATDSQCFPRPRARFSSAGLRKNFSTNHLPTNSPPPRRRSAPATPTLLGAARPTPLTRCSEVTNVRRTNRNHPPGALRRWPGLRRGRTVRADPRPAALRRQPDPRGSPAHHRPRTREPRHRRLRPLQRRPRAHPSLRIRRPATARS